MSDWPVEPQSEATPPVPAPEAPAERYPFWSYQDLAVLAGLALPSLVVAALAVEAALRKFSSIAPGQPSQLLVAQFVGYLLWFLCLYGLLRLRYGRPFWRSLAWVVPAPGVLLSCAVWGPMLALGVSVLGVLLRTPETEMPIKQFLKDQQTVLLVALFASTLGPLSEELMFRGFLLPLVVRSLGAVGGVVAAALPFALLHGPQYGWSWRHILLVTVAGSAFGWVRYRTGSTAAAAIMHATYNLTFFIGFLFQEKGSAIRW